MGHLTAPLLRPSVVAELTGLSPATLRRWDSALLLPNAAKRPRRYSWAEVEALQRAVHLASGRGGTPSAFKGSGRRPRGGAGRAPGGVVSVAAPRSARRRDARRRQRSARAHPKPSLN